MDNVQHAAVTVISRVLSGRNLNQVLGEVLNSQRTLSVQQRGGLQDLSYGTLRFYGQLTSVLDMLLDKPIQDEQIRYLLLIALYQLQHSKAAQHAVVDFAVKAVRKHKPAASGLVNAVLRNFLRKKDILLAQAAQTDVGRYSYPQWWIDNVKHQYGTQADQILTSGNLHPPMTLRVNQRRVNSTDYLAMLKQNGIQAELIVPDAIFLAQPVPVEKLPGFMDGFVSVQDAGAQYAARFLDLSDGMRVLDACSAPGGKTAHMLELAKLQLTSLDKDPARLERVKENLVRLQLEASILTGDAARPEEWWDGQPFQRILADVPCSAAGVVRRHPDIKWLRRASDIENFARQQQQILEALWPLLESEGKLLYVTCSIFDRENQQVIKWFLNGHKDAHELPLSGPDMQNGQLLPNDHQDGFFYALLQKKS